MSSSTTEPYIYTRDLTTLTRKLRQTLSEGPDKFRIVSDFDSTISSPKGPSSWCVIETSPILSDAYRKRSKDYSAKYYPKEIDPTLTFEERCNWMVEWWMMAKNSLRDENITRKKYNKILLSAQQRIIFRDGIDKVLELSHRLNIPLLVFSAGVGDIIDAVFIHHFSQYYLPANDYYPIEHLPKKTEPVSSDSSLELISHLPSSPAEYGAKQGIPKTIYIIANHLEFEQDRANNSNHNPPQLNSLDPKTFDSTDLVTGFRAETPIHVFNKVETLVQSAPYYENVIQPRTNAVCLGDSLGDAIMIHTDSPDNVIRIGFLQTNVSHNKTRETHLHQYLAKFDIVFVDSDDGFALVNQILALFQQTPPPSVAIQDGNRAVVFETSTTQPVENLDVVIEQMLKDVVVVLDQQ